MKTHFKKTLALLLSVGMLLCMLPLMAFAADDVCQIIADDGVIIVAAYDNLTGAWAAVEDGQTIRLLANIDYNAGLVITGKSITIDVNGYTLNVTNASGHALEVGAGGEVWLTDSGTGGKFNVAGGGSGAKHGVYVHDGGKAEVTNATTSGTGTDARGANAVGAGSEITVYGNITFGGFYGLGASAGATVTVYGNVNGGGGMVASGQGTKVEVYGYSNGGGTGVIAFDGAEVYVHGNVYGGGAGVYVTNGSKVTVDGYIRALTGGQVYVEFAAPVNIKKMQPDFEPVSSKDGYFEYNDGVSYVWVKYFNPPLLFTVTYEPGEHGTFAAETHSGVAAGTETPAVPATPGEIGWIFAGWYPEVSPTVMGNATYIAQWKGTTDNRRSRINTQ